jgi:hypothetical protein
VVVRDSSVVVCGWLDDGPMVARWWFAGGSAVVQGWLSSGPEVAQGWFRAAW